ncbi:NIPSNAP family containing protein [Pseudofrankia sp. BMG5.36]|uniref:NIPSNAP family containing protein n=1 Tax=Pseudofrankia sp. BMG5.36 TaxID=1834512 RepID=UPI0008DAD05C|nr:NIPSNAP family containing protein [Pseudofrankia sp. BMG5.36]OHV48931.1 NIPSNAP family containing protein [Pseudofrankia sp. BMG5.36]
MTANTTTANTKVYTHEFIDILGTNRANYIHHMTANWSPIAQEERNQLCYGVWGVIGTTGRWPQVINMWEEDGFDGLAAGLEHETKSAAFQDPKLAKWWQEASGYRSGGLDRIVVPAPWAPTIEQLCADGVRGDVYAHELVKVPRGTASDFLEIAADEAAPVYASFGWKLVGAFRTALADDSECLLLWAIESMQAWAELEKAATFGGEAVNRWSKRLREVSESSGRFLMRDAPLSPMRIGRQPSRADRHEGWTDL